MRFHQISIRYAEVIQEPGPRPLGDPWLIRPPTLVARPEWRPPVDLCETSSELIVKVEVAGLSEDDFDILLYEDALVIRGERPWHSCDAAARFHLAEIRHGIFRLELPVPATVDPDRVSAQYSRGFLLVNLPKAD
jgi:HSP20 family molecular chaperone IbpA